MIDTYERIDWQRVERARFHLTQEFRYDYPGPIADLEHRLVIAPLERSGTQRRIGGRLDVTPPIAVHTGADRFGNEVMTARAERIETSVAFQYAATVERRASLALPAASSELTQTFLAFTPLTAADAALRDAARDLRALDLAPRELVVEINRFVARTMRYTKDVTTVATTAAEAFAIAAGVCQDYAHVMIALCRLCGISARYVSGHLLGEGGTHAWVEVLVPGEEASAASSVLAFDPTHDRRATLDYIIVATGRDYADVPPTSGRFTARYMGSFSAKKAVKLESFEYAA